MLRIWPGRATFRDTSQMVRNESVISGPVRTGMGKDKDVTTTHMDRQTVETDRFRSFVRATYPDLKLYALRRVGPAGAEDVVSETYVVAWRKWVDPPAHRSPPVTVRDRPQHRAQRGATTSPRRTVRQDTSP